MSRKYSCTSGVSNWLGRFVSTFSTSRDGWRYRRSDNTSRFTVKMSRIAFSSNDANIILIKKTSAAHPAGGGRIFRDQDDGEYALATDADKRSKADAVDLDSFVMLIQMQARPMSMAAGPKANAKGGKPGHSDDTKPGFVDGNGRKHFTDCNKCHSYGHWTAGCTD